MKSNLKPEGNDNCGITTEITKRPNENEWKGIGKISGIYKIVNKVNGKYYVGSAKDIFGARKRGHKNKLNKNIHTNIHLQNAWNKYGKDNFEFVIVEKVLLDKLTEIEQKYLDIAKKEKHNCYNISFIAGRIEMNKETKQKMSNNHANFCGNKNPMYGKHHTEETIKKIRKLNKINFSGEKNLNYDNTIYRFQNKITNEIFEGTQYNLKKKYNLGEYVCNLVTRKRKSHKNWILLN